MELLFLVNLTLTRLNTSLSWSPCQENLTTFSTYVGLYRFKRLKYGTVSAQEEFDHGIRQTLAGTLDCANISGDIIVYGKDTADHKQKP